MSAPTLSDYAVHRMLDYYFGQTAGAPPATFYVKLLSGGVELSGNGYARLAITNNTTNFAAAASRTKLMQVIQSFAAATGAWNTVDGWELMDAASGGNAWLSGGTQDLPSLCRAQASDSTLNKTSQPFSDNDAVRVDALSGHSLPTNLAADTTYYVRDSASGSYKLAATAGGVAIAVGDGLALVSKWYGKSGIVATDVYQIPANGLKIKLQTAALA